MVVKKRESQPGLSQILPELIKSKGWEVQLDLYSIFPHWKKLASEGFAAHSLPLKIERGVLWLQVENSAWMQQLRYEQIELLDLLNQSLKLGDLKDVKMVLPQGSKENNPGMPVEAKPVRFSAPDSVEIESFRRQIASIADATCRESLMQFWYLSHACKRGK